jgi:hypothetical protein
MAELFRPFPSLYSATSATLEECLMSDELSRRRDAGRAFALTNAGVARLARLPGLRELRVSGKGVTSEVVDAFSPPISVFYTL